MNTNVHILIGRAVCQLLAKNTPIYETTIADAIAEIFNSEYSGTYDADRAATLNAALKLLTNNSSTGL
ncbi:hypothetical protein [Xenorhabdus miraniensis]|uniref:Uncharacterized protein n=1 Tax=Xenorhabdus miraniensis TaxID=351674 RepID=A0A2D0JJW9_9GAMM|nr:hypothetical protein [Xenorhabdus miraniensis]PHM46615.1 hypothetical protein Xmir_04053 [Xenorhabdus miraniensis]